MADMQKKSVAPPQKYLKMKGFANMKGEWFEVKLAALLFLRGVNSGRQFQLATNAKGADALDDIIFKIRPFDNAEWHISFIQLKHKEFAKLNIDQFIDPGGTGNFALKKYLKSCNEIKKVVSETSKQVLFQGTFDLCTFVIYTNAEVHFELEKRLGYDRPCPMEEFLKSNLERERIFSFDEKRDKDVYSFLEKFGVEESKEFLKRLKIFSGQPSEEQLDIFIKEELPKACGKSKIDADLMYRFYEEEFKLWWRDSNHILDQNSDILFRTKNRLKVETLSPQQEEKFKLKIKFHDYSIEGLTKALADKTAVTHIITDGISLRFSCTKLLQVLNKEKGAYIFFGTESLLQERNSLISVWKRGTNHLLVIVSESTGINEGHNNLCTDICRTIEDNNEKRIVMLSSHNDVFAQRIKENIGIKFTSVLDPFELSELDDESTGNILQKKLLFQGYETTLNSLLEGSIENATEFLKHMLVETVLTRSSLAIGNDVKDVIHYYIQRTLEQKNGIEEDIFNERKIPDKILVSGINAQELNKLLPVDEQHKQSQFREGNVGLAGDPKSMSATFLVLSPQNADAEYNKVCESNANVHWLQMNNGKLIWNKSQGNVSLVKKYVKEDYCSTFNPHTAMDIKNRLVLLIAEPGMGKSTILIHLAKQTKEVFPDLWVIRIALNDQTALLAKSSENGFNAVEFLAAAIGIEKMPHMDQALFKFFLEKNGNVVVLLDGFDEIAPRYANECCTLLTKLLETKIRKIWVTSRHSMKDTLEHHLATLAFTLRKFDEKDQRDFFTKFWKNTSALSENDLDTFITDILHLSEKSLNDKEIQFTGIPLQTHMMAEVFEDHVKNKEKRELPEKMDVLLLIETFVEKKLKIYYQEKMKISDAHTDYDELLKEKRASFIKKHKIAALILLLQEEEVKTLHKKILNKKSKVFLDDIKNGKDKTGIIDSIIADKPHFLHRVFAEYFAAKWLAKHFTKNQSFLEDSFSAHNFVVVREIFDRILARDKNLHTAVLNADKQEVDKLLTGGVDVNETDLGGRTALHLASSVLWKDQLESKRDTHIAELLLKYSANIDCVDNVIHGTPLRYADLSRCWYIVEILLGYENVNLDNLITTKTNLHDETMWENVIQYGYVKLMSYLLNNGLHVNSTFNDRGESLLHKAAYFGTYPILSLLIDQGSSLTQQDSEMSTPLHLATLEGHESTVKLLLEGIGDADATIRYIDAANADGNTAVHNSVIGQQLAVLKILLQAGGRVAATNNFLSTPLHMASLATNLQIIQLLIDQIPDETGKLSYINAPDVDGSSALYWAAEQGDAITVEYLIKAGSDVTLKKTNSGDTALHVACLNGHTLVAHILVESVSDTSRKSEYINTCNSYGHTALFRAAQQGYTDIATLLAKEGTNMTLASDDGFNPLQKACEKGHTNVVRALIDNMSTIERIQCINGPHNDCYTALYWAVVMGHAEVVEILLKEGGDYTRRDVDGANLLHVASLHGHLAVVEALIHNIADPEKIAEFVNARDSDNKTAACYAARENHEEIVRILVNAGGEGALNYAEVMFDQHGYTSN